MLLALIGSAVTILACAGDPAPTRTTPFDGEAAMRYARAQVEFGPRVPGSEAWTKRKPPLPEVVSSTDGPVGTEGRLFGEEDTPGVGTMSWLR